MVVVARSSEGDYLGYEVLELREFSPAPALEAIPAEIGEVIQPLAPPDHGEGAYEGSGQGGAGGYFASSLLRADLGSGRFDNLKDELLIPASGTSGPRALVRLPAGASPPYEEILRIRPCEPWNDDNEGEVHVVWRTSGAGDIAWPYALDLYHVDLPIEGSVPVLAADSEVTGSSGGIGLELPGAIGFSGTSGPHVYKDLTVHWDGNSRILSAAGDGWVVLVLDPDETTSDGDDDQCFVFRVRGRDTDFVEDQELGGSPTVFPWAIGTEIAGPDPSGWAYGLILEGTNYARWLQVHTEDDLWIDQIGGTPRPPDVYDGSEQNRQKKQIIPVNEGTLKVLWRKELTVRNSLGTEVGVIDYSNRIRTYDCYWPDDPALENEAAHYDEDPAKIVIAAQTGTGRLDLLDTPSVDADVYYQNLAAEPGFNPNDEHAWRTNRVEIDPSDETEGEAIYAVRADLYGQASTAAERAQADHDDSAD